MCASYRYLASRAQFAAQMTSIDEAKQSVRTFLGFQTNADKPLIIVGTYVIGKNNQIDFAAIFIFN